MQSGYPWNQSEISTWNWDCLGL